MEIFLSTPNKICLLRTKFVYSEQNLCTLVIFGLRTFGICEFLFLYSTTAVCVHLYVSCFECFENVCLFIFYTVVFIVVRISLQVEKYRNPAAVLSADYRVVPESCPALPPFTLFMKFCVMQCTTDENLEWTRRRSAEVGLSQL